MARGAKGLLDETAPCCDLELEFILGHYEDGILKRAPGHLSAWARALDLDWLGYYGEPNRWMSLSAPGEV